jgi:hypothetical protein
MKHVQVERYFISQRYRVGAVTIGPQMSVDAAERQVTADRSLAALPASLQAITLYEAKGELVEAAGGCSSSAICSSARSTPSSTCSSRSRRARWRSALSRTSS